MNDDTEQPRVLRKFIAGARCPSCGTTDTLYVFEREGATICACVDCGEIENPRPHEDDEPAAAPAPDIVRIIEPTRTPPAADGSRHGAGEH